jgi:hypothetical protein
MLHGSFARPVGLFDNWFNGVVAGITGGAFCHSEFIFSWDTDTATAFLNTVEGQDRLKERCEEYEEDNMVNICFYVLWGDTCSYRFLKNSHRNKFYRTPNEAEYEQVEIPINMEEEYKLARFLLEQCGKNYDYVGALTCFVPFRKTSNIYDVYFCSQLMVCALQHVDKLKNVNPSGVTPNTLYKLLLTSL